MRGVLTPKHGFWLNIAKGFFNKNNLNDVDVSEEIIVVILLIYKVRLITELCTKGLIYRKNKGTTWNSGSAITLGLEDWRVKELAFSRKGYWRMAKALNQVISNKIVSVKSDAHP